MARSRCRQLCPLAAPFFPSLARCRACFAREQLVYVTRRPTLERQARKRKLAEQGDPDPQVVLSRERPRMKRAWFESLTWLEKVFVLVLIVSFLTLRWLRGAPMSDIRAFLRDR